MFIPSDFRIWEVKNDKGESLGAYLYGDMVIKFNNSVASIHGAYAWLDSINYTYKVIGEIYPLEQLSDNLLVQAIKYKWILKQKNAELKRSKKKGYRLESIIRIGKYKYYNKTIKNIIEEDKPYFDWLVKNDVILLHPEIYEYIKKINHV